MDEASWMKRELRVEQITSLLYEHARKPYSVGRLREMRLCADELRTLIGKDPKPEDEVQIADVAHEAVSPPLKSNDLNERVDALNAAEALLDGRMSTKETPDG